MPRGQINSRDVLLLIRNPVVLGADTRSLAVRIHRRLLLRPPAPLHGVLRVHSPHYGLSDEGRSTPSDGGPLHGYGKSVQVHVKSAILVRTSDL